MKHRIDKRGYKYWVIGKPNPNSTLLMYEGKNSLTFRLLETHPNGVKTSSNKYILSFKNNRVNLYGFTKQGKLVNRSRGFTILEGLIKSATKRPPNGKYYFQKSRISSINKIIYKQARKHKIKVPRINFKNSFSYALVNYIYPMLFIGTKGKSSACHIKASFYRATSVKTLFERLKIRDTKIQDCIKQGHKTFIPRLETYFVLRGLLGKDELLNVLNNTIKSEFPACTLKEVITLRKTLKTLDHLEELFLEEDINKYYSLNKLMKEKHTDLPQFKKWKDIYSYIYDEKFKRKYTDKQFSKKFNHMLEAV